MLKFLFQCLALLLVLFLGVLLGMQQANDGLMKMKGYKDPAFNGAFDVEKSENGEMEAAVLGNRVTTHNIKEKKEQLEEIKAFNFFSNLGSKISNGVTTAFQVTITFIIDGIDKLLSSFG